MNDPDPVIFGRNDAMSPPSLPPNQKLAKDIWGDCWWLAVLLIGLVAARWDIITKGEFFALLMAVVSIKSALATGKGISLETMQQYLRR